MLIYAHGYGNDYSNDTAIDLLNDIPKTSIRYFYWLNVMGLLFWEVIMLKINSVTG